MSSIGGVAFSDAVRFCGSSSVDRALAFQAEGRGFEPRLPLLVKTLIVKQLTIEVSSFIYIQKLLNLTDFRGACKPRCKLEIYL